MTSGVGLAARLVWGAAPRAFAGLVAAALAGAAAPVCVAWLTRGTVDALVGGSPPGPLAALATGLAVAGVVTATLPQVERFLGDDVGRRSARAAIARLHRSVGRMTGLARFEDPVFLDRLQVATLAEVAPGQIVGGGLSAGRGLLATAGLIGSLAVISPPMTAIVLLAAVPTLLAELALARRRAADVFTLSPAQRRELFYRELLGDVSAAKEIRLFGLTGLLTDRMLAQRRAADDVRHATDRRELRVQGGLALLGAVVAGGGLVWAVRAARQGTLSIGDVTLFLTATAGVQASLASAIAQLAQVHQRFGEFTHFRTVIATPPDLPVVAAPRPVPPLRTGIELRDVWFRYAPELPWALRGVSAVVPRGSATALVGRNGSGKSTLVKLLCRFYDPDRGAILWDGVDLREFAPAALRDRITAVFQDFVRYEMTAGENVGLGDLDALTDDDRIRAAARRAGVDAELAALPAGYRTPLTRIHVSEADRDDPSTGVVLSGGQWQRVAVARAFLRAQRDLSILDEPSSGLDAEAEARIHAGLREHRRGRTSVLVSHRLGTLRDADRILVLDAGSLVETGTHETLLADGGVYASLYSLQAAGYAEVAG